uniref:Uncharacterized protein n=1 Tax=Anguilla anguilla TaxID=7936 RepID=A0A0E9TUP0_ANGAN
MFSLCLLSERFQQGCTLRSWRAGPRAGFCSNQSPQF